MPGDNRGRLHDRKNVGRPPPSPRREHPERPVDWAQTWSWRCPLHHRELVPQRQTFQHEVRSRLEGRKEGPEDGPQNRRHDEHPRVRGRRCARATNGSSRLSRPDKQREHRSAHRSCAVRADAALHPKRGSHPRAQEPGKLIGALAKQSGADTKQNVSYIVPSRPLRKRTTSDSCHAGQQLLGNQATGYFGK
jgi:hypothetical protein